MIERRHGVVHGDGSGPQSDRETISDQLRVGQLGVLRDVEADGVSSHLPRCASRITAATELESTPPERKSPTGTSDTMWLVTASASRSRTSSVASPPLTLPGDGTVSCQYRSVRTAPFSSTSISPGRTFRIEANAVTGAGT